jgi:gluconate 2-dehydrogenase gamma chain
MTSINRRDLLKASVLAGSVGGVVGAASSSSARTITGEMPWTAGRTDTPPVGALDRRFFTEQERSTIEAIVSRLIPSDEEGPGAAEAGVADFLDFQMAGFYGRGQRWYMLGPWDEGEDTQGYQSRLTPSGLYRAGLTAIDAHCRATYAERNFSDLDAATQDEILTAIEEETLDFDDVPAKLFFDLVLENTIEGFFSDPIYGGNRDMVGWRLVGFPGARYDYRAYLDHDGAALDIPPLGLGGRPAWSAD